MTPSIYRFITASILLGMLGLTVAPVIMAAEEKPVATTTESTGAKAEKLLLGLPASWEQPRAEGLAGELEKLLEQPVDVRRFEDEATLADWFKRYRILDLAVISRSERGDVLHGDYLLLRQLTPEKPTGGRQEQLVAQRNLTAATLQRLTQGLGGSRLSSPSPAIAPSQAAPASSPAAPSPDFAAGGGEFPYTDPLVATILGTPAEQKAPLVEDLRLKILDLTILPERKVPAVLWYNEQLRCSLAYQKQKAPLIFVIAGTGAGFNSDKMLALQSIFYRAGFHVVSISSPTHANFITAASESAAPGILPDDARDLYRVMLKVRDEIKDDIEISNYYLTGYSLGGAQAAFVSQIDEEMKRFDFRKVLMINPPVSLYSSATLFDRMLEDNVPGGVEKTGAFLRERMDRLAKVYSAGDFVKFDNEFLYNIYRNMPEAPDDKNLAASIGLSFRISAVNMMFATDVMTQAGFVVPKGMPLDNNDPLDDYFRTLMRISFSKYLDELLLPIAQGRNPKLTRQALIDASSLKSIESYLRRADKVGVLTNQDDFILGAGELDYLKRLFGDRARVFPRGAHCGNIDHRDVAAYLTTYFTQP